MSSSSLFYSFYLLSGISKFANASSFVFYFFTSYVELLLTPNYAKASSTFFSDFCFTSFLSSYPQLSNPPNPSKSSTFLLLSSSPLKLVKSPKSPNSSFFFSTFLTPNLYLIAFY